MHLGKVWIVVFGVCLLQPFRQEVLGLPVDLYCSMYAPDNQANCDVAFPYWMTVETGKSVTSEGIYQGG